MEQLLLERKRKLSMANVKRKYESQAKKDRRLGLILMIPIILVVFGIMGYPFCRALYLSFTNKVVGKPEEFVGLENYIKLFHDPIYWKSLKNTLVYTVGCIAAKLALGLLWAVLLNRSFKGKSFFPYSTFDSVGDSRNGSCNNLALDVRQYLWNYQQPSDLFRGYEDWNSVAQ